MALYREYLKRDRAKGAEPSTYARISHGAVRALSDGRHRISSAPAQLPPATAAVSRTAPGFLQAHERAMAEHSAEPAGHSNRTAGVDVVIEGERVKNGYQGLYFPTSSSRSISAASIGEDFTGWHLNGRSIPGTGPLKFKAEHHTQIEAVFDNRSGGRRRGCRRRLAGS